MIAENVVPDPCANVNAAATVTADADDANTDAISCLGVPGSTTIVAPDPNAVPPDATVITVPPGYVVAADALPDGETWLNPATA